jgi:hypothetical protein
MRLTTTFSDKEFYRIAGPYIEEYLQLKDSRFEYHFGMVRISNEEFRTVEWREISSGVKRDGIPDLHA